MERARARQEAQQWSADLVKNESDEEREQRKARKATNRKVKSEAPSGDEGLSTPLGGGGNDGEPKKKRRKLKKSGGVASAVASTQPSDAEEGALFSEGEEEKPLKKVLSTFLISLGAFLMVRLLTSVEQRESVLHEKKRTSQPLRPVKSNSKSLCLIYRRRCTERLLFFLYGPFFRQFKQGDYLGLRRRNGMIRGLLLSFITFIIPPPFVCLCCTACIRVLLVIGHVIITANLYGGYHAELITWRDIP